MCLGCEVRQVTWKRKVWGVVEVNVGVPGPQQIRRTVLVFQRYHNNILQTRHCLYKKNVIYKKLTTDIYFLIVLEIRSSRSRCQHDWFLACRQVPSWCVLKWPLLWAHRFLASLLLKTLILLDQSPTRMTPFNFNYIFKRSISKYNHTGDQGSTYGIWSGHNSIHNRDLQSQHFLIAVPIVFMALSVSCNLVQE